MMRLTPIFGMYHWRTSKRLESILVSLLLMFKYDSILNRERDLKKGGKRDEKLAAYDNYGTGLCLGADNVVCADLSAKQSESAN